MLVSDGLRGDLWLNLVVQNMDVQVPILGPGNILLIKPIDMEKDQAMFELPGFYGAVIESNLSQGSFPSSPSGEIL